MATRYSIPWEPLSVTPTRSAPRWSTRRGSASTASILRACNRTATIPLTYPRSSVLKVFCKPLGTGACPTWESAASASLVPWERGPAQPGNRRPQPAWFGRVARQRSLYQHHSLPAETVQGVLADKLQGGGG